MTDREMLELAAKAAGMRIHAKNQAERDEIGFGDKGLWIVGGSSGWNPLTYDGDALRLAVKIGMLIDVRYTQQESIRYNRATYWPEPSRGEVIEFGDEEMDPAAATRRAITRAAAEIGMEMK